MYTMNPKTEEVRNYNSAVPRVKDWDAWATASFFTQTLGWEGNLRDEHHIGVMVGQDYQEFYNDNFQAYKEGRFYDNYHHRSQTPLLGQATLRPPAPPSRESWSRFSTSLLRLQKQRYLVSVASSLRRFRRVWPPRPPLGLLLPLGLAGGWRIGPENFMKERGVHRPAQTAFLVG